MGRFRTIKKKFEFLERIYGFEIYLKQKHGAYYYIVWSNNKTNIMVLYDEQVDEDPITIRIYDADSVGFDAEEYKNEFDQRCGSPREKIHRAAEWLSNAIIEQDHYGIKL